MKLSQYIYGRKPKAGLQVITRSRELPFFVQSWFESPRYGAEPVRSTPDRVWTRRYELQCFENGAALSCLYPLKQTEVPCSEQTEPYIRGITPAVQHLLAGAADVDALLSDVDAALHFDGFHDIDDIYRLPSSFAEPVEYTAVPCAPAALTEQERNLCVDMAAYLWQAFLSRKDGKMGELAQRAVRLIVPAGEPAQELEDQRRLVGYTLKLLPPYIRRWTSVTLNMDVESDSYPSGSALYGMVRANAGSQPAGKSHVFDAESMVWPSASPEERGYFMARELQSPVVDLDVLVDQLPAKYDLAFHVRLQNLLSSACGGHLTLDSLDQFIAAESLQDFKPQLCLALAKAVIRTSGSAAARQQLAVLWTLVQADRSVAAELFQLNCPVDECIAIITRSGVLTAYTDVYPADEDFFNLIIRLSAADQSPLAPESVQSLQLWLSRTAYSATIQMLVNALIQYGKLVIDNRTSLLLWLENSFICRMKELANSPAYSALLDTEEPDVISRLLLTMCGLNRGCEWTTGVEKLLIEWFDRHGQLPAWDAASCLTAANRAVELTDQQLYWPMLAIRAAAALNEPSEACLLLLRDPQIRALPQLQPYVQQFSGYVYAQNVDTLRASIHTPDDLLGIADIWNNITNGAPLKLASEQWISMQTTFQRAIQSENVASSLELYNKLRRLDLPSDCIEQAEIAIAAQIALALPGEDLTRLQWQDLDQVLNLVQKRSPLLSNAAQQRIQILYFLNQVMLHPVHLPTFESVRKEMKMLTADHYDLLNTLFGIHMPKLAASILLRHINRDNTINWSRAFACIMDLYSLPNISPNEVPRCSVEDYEIFLCMLCGLYLKHPNSPIGYLLTPADCQQLSDWLLAGHPKLIKQLMNDQKKYGDLPDAVVQSLQLYLGRR